MFKGSIPALITPFTATGAVDEDSFVAHVEWQIAEGSHGLVPVGTTGESPTLSHAEHKRVVELCIKTAAGRVPGYRRRGIQQHIRGDRACAACRKGWRGTRSSSSHPITTKPDPEGSFRSLCGRCRKRETADRDLQHPRGRSVVDMNVETMAALHRAYPSIIGVKDATGKIERVSEQRMACGPQFRAAVRRRRNRPRLQRPWWRRLHFGDGERRAPPLC